MREVYDGGSAGCMGGDDVKRLGWREDLGKWAWRIDSELVLTDRLRVMQIANR